MTDLKLTKDKMLTFSGHEKLSALKAPAKLTEFGEKQNDANMVLAENISELVKRVCMLETQQEKNAEIMAKIAGELNSFKKELDRVRLTEKLNSGAIERLDRAVRLAEGDDE